MEGLQDAVDCGETKINFNLELKKLLNVKNVVTIYDVDFRIKKMITFEIGDQLTVDSTIQQLELVGILRKYIEVVNKTDPTIKR